ncbi:hypothetical protein ADUPG1_008434, partial [Aduncisulcus paluster]
MLDMNSSSAVQIVKPKILGEYKDVKARRICAFVPSFRPFSISLSPMKGAYICGFKVESSPCLFSFSISDGKKTHKK